MRKWGKTVKLFERVYMVFKVDNSSGQQKMHNQRMGSPKRLGSSILFAALAAFLCLPASFTIAQFQGRPRIAQFPSAGLLMPKPREVQALLDDVQVNIASEEWSEASLGLGMLLGLEPEEDAEPISDVADYFLIDEDEVDKVESPTGSVFGSALELIESLPEEGRNRFELRYGAKSAQMLEAAIANSDWSEIATVAGNYSFTVAGQDACLILGEHWLRKGEPRRAARFLKRLAAQKTAMDRLGAPLGILTAATQHAIGEQAEAFKMLEATRERFSRVSFDWRGTKIGWDGRSKLSKDILDGLIVGQKAFARFVREPHYLGGNSNRNADTSAGTPLPFVKWHAELHESRQHKVNLEKSLAGRLDGKTSVTERKPTYIPTRYPISVGQWVITSTYDQRIVAIDAFTGRLGWECFYSGMPLGFTMERFSGRDSHALNYAAPDYLMKRVWGETILGMLSSDGERIYSISELPAIDVAESFAQGQNARVAKMQTVRNFNVMQCWSVREEGKIKWEVGGMKSPSEPLLSGCLFLGSPLPHDNQLFVMGELNSDVYLFVLSPETGKLIRRQPIATNASAIAGDQLRRNVGASPTADGTTIICPTLSGYVVAIDSVSHAFQWSFQYPTRNNAESSNQFSQFGLVDFGNYSPMQSRSSDVAAVVQDGVVLFAPSDGEGVYALSLETGKLLWQIDPKQDPVRYVAGVWNGMALIACQSNFMAIDLKSGKERWPSIDLPRDGQVVGKGVRKEKDYYLPTSGQEILQIDLENGSIAEAVKVEQPLGNLTSVGDRIISASPFQLDCYAVREAFQSQVKTELQGNTASATGLAHQGELALAQGDFDSALTLIDKASSLDATNAEILWLKNKIGIAALTENFDKYVDRVSLSKDLAFDRDRSPYLRLLVHGLQKQGRHRDALMRLLEISELRSTQRQDQMSSGDNINLTPTHSVQEDRWIATNIRRSLERLSEADLAQIQPDINATLEKLRQLPSNIRRMRLEHLQAFAATGSLRVEAARELVKFREWMQAENLLLGDGAMESAKQDSEDIKSRRELLARIYAPTRRFDLALEYLNGDKQLLSKLMADSLDRALPQAINVPTPNQTKSPTKPIEEWPKTKTDIKVTPASTPGNINLMQETMTMCRSKSRIGIALRDWSVFSGTTTWSFLNRASRDGFQIYIEAGNQDRATIPNIYAVDSIALIEFNRQIIAIDTLQASTSEQDGLLWRKPFESQPLEPGRGAGKATIERNNWGLPTNKGAFRVAAVSRNGIIVLHEDKLICLDLQTGNSAWTLTGFSESQFASQDQTLFAYVAAKQSIVHIDMRDGSTLKEIPFAESGWNVAASTGRYLLLASTATKKYGLKLLDASDGRVLLQKDFSNEAKIAIDGEAGIYGLTNAGELTFWNIADEKEYTHQIKTEGKLNLLSAQRFGDTVLLLPHSASMELEFTKVAPDSSDTAYVPVAGQLIAVSAKDGSSLWKQSGRVQQMFFPVAQDRSSPVAVFVRRLELSKVANRNIDLTSVAVVDVRYGRVLFKQDDLPTIRNRGFLESVDHDKNRVEIDYEGNKLEVAWTGDELGDEPQFFDFGEIKNEREFKKQIEEKYRQQKPSPDKQGTLEPVPSK